MKKIVLLLAVFAMGVACMADSFLGFPIRQATASGQGYEAEPSQEWAFSADGSIGNTAYTTVWNCCDSTSVAIASAVDTIEVASSSASDTSAGNYAKTVRICGIDTDYNYQENTISLDGQTVVVASEKFLAVFGAAVETVGSSATAAGDIWGAYNDTFAAGVPQTDAKKQFKIPSGAFCVSNNAWGFVPNDLKGRFKCLSFTNNASSGYTNYALLVKQYGGPLKEMANWDVNDQLTLEEGDLNISLPEKCYWEIRAKDSAGYGVAIKVNGVIKLE